MGTRRKRRRQEALWVATTDLPQTVAHPFYRRVNALLDAHGFDAFVERHCQRFYAATRGRPSLTPGIYFRALLVGYFEGIDSERGIAWRAADSLAIRRFLGIAVDEAVPDHSTRHPRASQRPAPMAWCDVVEPRTLRECRIALGQSQAACRTA